LINIDSIPLWRKILRRNFTDWQKLANYLELTEEQKKHILQHPRFVLSIPERLAAKIRKGNLEDPILRQFLPTTEENNHLLPFFVKDPVGDQNSRCSSKLLHKYQGRVLLICTSACAMHCRYCFRQNFDYDTEGNNFDNELAIIANDPSIHEVILSGGDPLSLSDRVLKALFDKLSQIPHIRRLRFHTRFPIGIPERINNSFLEMLTHVPFQIWFVVHANHPREFDEDILASFKSLRKLGVIILNQSVLLKGVNDDPLVLQELYELLVNNGMIPYYLHQLDRVQGAAHFEVSEDIGMRLIDELSSKLPGYAVPKYVREIAGTSSKTPIK
jgi:EF-P beta-lysylation protein EpmB